ncbi:MAG TPA: GAF domain-containing sensor histidine kinase [Solirubrobacterales bacterium]|nr:GAF domain-containing sensor histidine kinase [Solirubrobacterales bacterium]
MTDAPSQAAVRLARDILTELDLEEVLQRALAAAREVTGARYAALGVLDADGRRLARFLTLGIDEETKERIGPPPTGHGVLGKLISKPEPLRLDDIGAHPHSYGFPMPHPPMVTFLGVPIFVGSRAFGNLYLTDKEGGAAFTEADEEATVLLAEFAGLAIEHADRFTAADRARRDLQRNVEALDATVAISRTLAAQTDLGTILDLVAKRGRALVAATSLVIELTTGEELEVAAVAGEASGELVGARLPVAGTVAQRALETHRSQRIEEAVNHGRFRAAGLGSLGLAAEAGLVVPLILRGRAYGALVALDRLEDGPRFTERDEELLAAFATSAATALATARSFDAGRRRERLAASEAERARWARELHDGTLQGLAALRLGFAAIERAGDLEGAAALATDAGAEAEREIEALRSLVTDLRPPILEGRGLGAAIELLAEHARRSGVAVEADVRLGDPAAGTELRFDPELEIAGYRIVQEAVSNALRHAGAARIRIVAVIDDEREDTLSLSVRDDGRGFDPDQSTGGFGLAGMRERIGLLGGSLRISSGPGEGTEVRASLPTEAQPGSGRDDVEGLSGRGRSAA